ncbi:MAG: protein jag [Oscillospiraceae bacterium]|nr:protein jag [Oscillospiraceae bacterium]
MKEVIASGKTLEQALEEGALQLGKTPDQVEYEVLEEGKKGLFGIGATDTKLRVYLPETPASRAVDFLETLLANMGLEADVEVVSETEEEISLNIVGEHLGALIGRRGDVLDSVQYLATLSANLGNPGYYRVSVDAQGYRARRVETVQGIARRMAEKVLKYRRAFSLDPMSPYERRIVHSACQEIPGVTTHSIGEGADRRVVISPEKPPQRKFGE